MKIEIKREGKESDKKANIAKDEKILVNNDNNNEHTEQMIFSFK